MALLARLALLALLAGGCYDPELSPCALSCSQEVGCPEGLVCGSEARCVYDEATICSALPRVLLNIEISGQGRVVDSLNGIDCTEDCALEFPIGTQVKLMPLPAEEWEFKHWHKSACPKDEWECLLVLDESVTATAEFED